MGEEWVKFAPEAFEYAYDEIRPFITEEIRDQRVLYPEPLEQTMFRALQATPPSLVRVVIVGQDPFHDGRATGLCFDNRIGDTVSPSLLNILKKIKAEYPERIIPEGDSYLGHLPSQGVLLINTALSVRKANAGSHVKIWKPFTEKLVSALQKKNNVVWILWGEKAKSLQANIINPTHYILTGVHPSPLAGKGFFEADYFKPVNAFLKSQGYEQINW